jgi:hypothetical protein
VKERSGDTQKHAVVRSKRKEDISMNDEQGIRVVQFREGPWLVAQCLEVDIAAQRKTEDDLLRQLNRLLVGRVLASEKLGVEPFATLPPAPQRYWDMYSEATSQPAKILPFITLQGGSAHSLPMLEMKTAA